MTTISLWLQTGSEYPFAIKIALPPTFMSAGYCEKPSVRMLPLAEQEEHAEASGPPLPLPLPLLPLPPLLVLPLPLPLPPLLPLPLPPLLLLLLLPLALPPLLVLPLPLPLPPLLVVPSSPASGSAPTGSMLYGPPTPEFAVPHAGETVAATPRTSNFRLPKRIGAPDTSTTSVWRTPQRRVHHAAVLRVVPRCGTARTSQAGKETPKNTAETYEGARSRTSEPEMVRSSERGSLRAQGFAGHCSSGLGEVDGTLGSTSAIPLEHAFELVFPASQDVRQVSESSPCVQILPPLWASGSRARRPRRGVGLSRLPTPHRKGMLAAYSLLGVWKLRDAHKRPVARRLEYPTERGPSSAAWRTSLVASGRCIRRSR